MIQEQVLVVTGARAGLGRHLAEHYLSLGWVVVGCSRQPSDLQLEHYHHFICDVSQAAEVSQMFLAIRREFGRVDALINNAGIFRTGLAASQPISEVVATFGVNLIGAFSCTQEAIRLMIRQRVGRIVFMSSIAVPMASAGLGAYAASKAGLEELTRAVAREVAPLGITVNAVGPSIIADSGMAAAMSADVVAQTIAASGTGREVSLDDVTSVIDFLLSPASRAVTGQIIYVGAV
ncbi:MAG: SDR family NAD(P)-dependent oxidoreductase [Caldiserica bacterium]|nr:SDR family NAD(P)-dependent oxidoreductase [Caldisericota bacterium]